VEYARDIAQRFNHAYGNTLRVPELLLSPTAANIVGSDGRKMSKSYGNQIPLFAESAPLKKIIRRYKTTPAARTTRRTPRPAACSRSIGARVGRGRHGRKKTLETRPAR